ncbi:MFS transporter [Oscillospiraceae bacterium HV4-5-C5C]|nr:MFS transporter [Oscillospiraceae bacterium HV4-5-C5C]
MEHSRRDTIYLAGMDLSFWFSWAFGMFSVLYLQEKGFSATRIGLINAVGSIVAFFALTFWGSVSDRMRALKPMLYLLLIAAAVSWGVIPLIPSSQTGSFLMFLALIAVANFFRLPSSTFTDNLLVRASADHELNYGMIRGLGSLSFAAGCVLINWLLPQTGTAPLFWIAAVCCLPVLFFLSQVKEPVFVNKTETDHGLQLQELLQNRPYIFFCIYIFFFTICYNADTSFITYFMADNDIALDSYAIFLGYRAALEFPTLFALKFLRARFPLKRLLPLFGLLMGLDSLCLSFLVHDTLQLILFSSLFGLGNGIYIGVSANYVYSLAPPRLKASAQAIFASVCSIASVIGSAGGGVVYDLLPSRQYYLMLGLILLSITGLFTLATLTPAARPSCPSA